MPTDPEYAVNREIRRRASEARETALLDVAAGMGLDLGFVRERASVGRSRLDRERSGDLAKAIELAVQGD